MFKTEDMRNPHVQNYEHPNYEFVQDLEFLFETHIFEKRL